MRRAQGFLVNLTSAALPFVLLAFFQLAAAQHHHGAPPESEGEGAASIPQVYCLDQPHMLMKDIEPFPVVPNYFQHPEHVGTIYNHIALMSVAWIVLLPIAVMLSIARSRWTLPTQLLFLLVNGLGVLAGTIYNSQTPDLYENNAHHKIGWIVSWIAVAWTVLGVFNLYGARRANSHQPVTTRNMAEYQRLDNTCDPDPDRWSNDSGQGTDRNTASLCHSSRTNSMNSEFGNLPASSTYADGIEHDEESEKIGILRNTKLDRFLSRAVPRFAVGYTLTTFNLIHTIFERFMVLLGFLGLMSGLIVFSGVFREKHIFNGMAHIVKGGIFFWYGLLTFGRWSGCFAEFGWAWNVRPGPEIVGRGKAWVPSAEFTESSVIAFYGASNVFLEHLAAWGEKWDPMDFEHVAITIMFFGGGVLGMLIESAAVRRFLSGAFNAGDNQSANEQAWSAPKSYVHSLNPVPALIIMLLGIMMSSHTQHSLVSGAIHKQWGTLFVGFALSRALTYVTFWLKPPKSYLPSRPPSEIIASFCLISGGAIFMASNKDTVWALEEYNLDAMFIFTVMMGLTSLLMAWTLFVIAIKGFATQKIRNRSIA